jgi:hypothetical protein
MSKHLIARIRPSLGTIVTSDNHVLTHDNGEQISAIPIPSKQLPKQTETKTVVIVTQ